MSRPASAQSLTIPAPIGGMNYQDPLGAMPETDAAWLLNVNVENRDIEMRNGFNLLCQITDITLGMGSYGSGSSAKFFAIDEDNINEISSTGTVTDVYTIGTPISVGCLYYKFNNKCVFIPSDNSADAFYYDGATWGVWTLAYSVSGTPRRLGVVDIAWYRGRIYGGPILGPGYIVYGDVGQVQGTIAAANQFDVTQIFSGSPYACFTGTFSFSNAGGASDYICFGNADGEVLVYSGDNPGSDNWTLAGKLQIGELLGTSSSNLVARMMHHVQYENDCLVMTKAGIVSLKETYQNSVQGVGLKYVTHKIDKYWQALTAYLQSYPSFGDSVTAPKMVYFERERKIFVYMPVKLNGSELNGVASLGCSILVYNLDLDAWSIYQLPETDRSGNATGFDPDDVGNLVYHQGTVLISAREFIFRMEEDLYSDDNTSGTAIGIYSEILSSPLLLNTATSIKVVQGVAPIIQLLDSPPSTQPIDISLNFDMGRKTTDAVSITPATTVSKNFYSVGGEGTYVQTKIVVDNRAQTTKKGFLYYAMNVIYKIGGML